MNVPDQCGVPEVPADAVDAVKLPVHPSETLPDLITLSDEQSAATDRDGLACAAASTIAKLAEELDNFPDFLISADRRS